ncbi:PRD domain-containing protein [Jeotgalibacillus haloalkalitolerans]|uniref:PRD domain-containing protein n=1 Tax=Jeotgalibacillus haloalkalitolerans TaxID=3104292 RepID=A0ABU5KNI1_9BACL|nr:PRD domain-containing protein [Jeotgalibacillus sp. HH7-29]MDZ5712822.1 PRD domain-containing protein [Jeotgalibacillus sp. HH7-29]
MKIKKILNNSAVVIKDSDGEKIVMGEGVGFQKRKNDLVSPAKIDKVFTMNQSNDHQKFEEAFKQFPEQHISLARDILSQAEKDLQIKINQYAYLSFTDHLSFAIERIQKGFIVENALLDQIKILYRKEYELGLWAKNYIKEKTNIDIPEDEVGNIALHLHTARMKINDMSSTLDKTATIQEITSIIENRFNINIVEDSLSYERLLSHLQLSLKHLFSDERAHQMDAQMSTLLKNHLSESYDCAQEVGRFIEEKYKKPYPEEEIIYIAMHIERFYTRSLKTGKVRL